MIFCGISALSSPKSILAFYGYPNSTSLDDLLVLKAIRHVATAPGECLNIGDWSNRTCPKSDGVEKNLLTTAEEEFLYQFQSITQPTRFRMGNQLSVCYFKGFFQQQDTLSTPAPVNRALLGAVST